MLPRLRDRWNDIHSAALGWQSAAGSKANLFSAVTRFLRNSQMIIIYAIGAVLFLNQEVSAAGIFVAMMIMMRALMPIDALISNWQNYTRFFSALARVDDVLRDADDRPRRPSLPELNGALTVSRVYAAAPGSDRIILNDVSFSVEPGRIVGVVGSSGAGKSCLARVLVGIWAPRRGSVSMGDHDLAHWNEDELGLRVGYMSQDIELLPGTIAENISRFDPDALADPTKVLEAVDLAGIQDLIKSLPEGLATPVGPGGHVLSGGQRSRVALARAVYGDPMLVVLDEPNSNLDAASEQTLIRATQRLQARGATVFIITHKLNILNYCDDVLVLNAGAVQAFASRELIVDRLPRLRAQPTLSVVGATAETGVH
jgi:ABC-type protease/lipase transport system fused ATPase/permease subunit